MPLVLSLPGLLARDPLPPAPALARLLSYAGATRREDAGLAAALAPRYGVQRQTDWPLAPIVAAALGIDTSDAYWLCAQPVTLVAGRDDVHLQGVVRDLSGDDARVLVATLNAHFADDGIAFVAPRPDAWFVRSPAPIALSTHPLDAATGRTLRSLLPEGADAGKWRRWQNEAQMLLFEHPVNVAREREGKPPANSVWLQFGGTMPPRGGAAASIRTWTDDDLVAALAVFAATPARPMPRSLAAVLADAPPAATSIVAFDARIDVGTVEREFAAPALAALRAGAIDRVEVVADGDGAALEWRAERPSMWSRWTSRLVERNLAAMLDARRSAGAQ